MRFLKLFLLANYICLLFPLYSQPLGQHNRTLYYNSSFAGSLGYGRFQALTQTNIPYKDIYKFRFYFFSIDHFIPKLHGGLGYSYEHLYYDANQNNISSNATLGAAYSHLEKSIHKIHYSPKFTFHNKVTIAPSVNICFESFNVNNKENQFNKYTNTYSPFDQATISNIHIGAGILINSKRFFAGLAFNRMGNAEAYINSYFDQPRSVFSNYTFQIGYSFLFKNFSFKPSFTYNTTNWRFGNLRWSNNRLPEYDNFHILNLPFTYKNRFLFGMSFTNIARLSVGYRNERFSINFSSKELFPINRSSNEAYPHELCLEVFFLNPKAKPFTKSNRTRTIKMSNDNRYKGKYVKKDLGINIGMTFGICNFKSNEIDNDLYFKSLTRLQNFTKRSLITPSSIIDHLMLGLDFEKKINKKVSLTGSIQYIPLSIQFELIGSNQTNITKDSSLVSYYEAYERYKYSNLALPLIITRHLGFKNNKYSLDLYAGPQLLLNIKATKEVEVVKMIDGGNLDSLIKLNQLYSKNSIQNNSSTKATIGLKVGVGFTTKISPKWSILWKVDYNYTLVQNKISFKEGEYFTFSNNFRIYSITLKRSF